MLEPFPLAFAIVVAPSILAQDVAADRAIRQAVERGAGMLRSHQLPDGSWYYPGHPVGITSLVGLALVESGASETDPAVRRAYQFVRGSARDELQTYDIALALMFLVRVDAEANAELIQFLGQRLVAGQLDSGGWTYKCPESFPELMAESRLSNSARASGRRGQRRLRSDINLSGFFGDNSNTQFGVLGVWTAGLHGLDVTGSMRMVERRFRSRQNSSGGWGYRTEYRDTDTMTCAGLMCLALAKGYLHISSDRDARLTNQRNGRGRPDQGNPAADAMLSDADIERGINRVGEYAAHMSSNNSLYYFWSLERVGMALRRQQFGRIDWYGRGSAILVRSQLPDGSWTGGRGPLADTSFALLFLNRANFAQEMPRMASDVEAGKNLLRPGNLQDLKNTVRPPK